VSEWEKKEKERKKHLLISHLSLAGKGRKGTWTECRNGLKAKPNKPLPSLL
jgi:hypothetical protein